jgi:fatty acid desaturase
METSVKDIWSAFSEFFAFLAPGILAYSVLLYCVPHVMANLMPRTPAKHRTLATGGPKGEAAEEKPGLNVFFVLLQAYVLGFILFGFSGVLDHLPSPAELIAGTAGVIEYNNMREEFRTNPPPECRALMQLGKSSDEDLCDTARAYLHLKNQIAAHDIEGLRTEYRLCRSVSFLCVVLACSAFYFRSRLAPRWVFLGIILMCAAALFFFKSAQRRMETRKESFRYALILKIMPDTDHAPLKGAVRE